MIHRLSCRIVRQCLADSDHPSDLMEVYVYGLECKMTDMLQLGILLICAIFLGCFDRLLCFCLCFTSIKQRIGGLHASTHLACISVFTSLSVCSAVIAGALPSLANRIVMVFCVITQTVILLVCKPKAHPNHPKSVGAHSHSRKTSLIVAGIQFVGIPCLSVFAPAPALAGALGGITAAVTLVLSNRERKEGKS